MVKTYALINSSNVVVDIILWDGNTETWQPDDGLTAIDVDTDTGVIIGMTYNSTGTGIGNTSDNKWIIPKEQEFEGLNWDINGNGALDMYAE
tara:strand:- start:215 stop:490 length:276 start_codon:yes stop_codon:yes gene_type:complete